MSTLSSHSDEQDSLDRLTIRRNAPRTAMSHLVAAAQAIQDGPEEDSIKKRGMRAQFDLIKDRLATLHEMDERVQSATADEHLGDEIVRASGWHSIFADTMSELEETCRWLQPQPRRQRVDQVVFRILFDGCIIFSAPVKGNQVAKAEVAQLLG